MASKRQKELEAAGMAFTRKFFSAADEEDAREAAKGQAEPPQEEPKPVKAEKHTAKEEKAVTEANTKPKKQVVSFRVERELAQEWKSYKAAKVGVKADDLAAAALKEYMSNHPLSGVEKEYYQHALESLKA